jgi:hypothetical protein
MGKNVDMRIQMRKNIEEQFRKGEGMIPFYWQLNIISNRKTRNIEGKLMIKLECMKHGITNNCQRNCVCSYGARNKQ